MKKAFPDALDSDETEGLVETHRLGLGVSHDSDAAQLVALIDSEVEHVPKQGLADAKPLRTRVHAEVVFTCEDGRIAGKATATQVIIPLAPREVPADM